MEGMELWQVRKMRKILTMLAWSVISGREDADSGVI